MPRGLGSKRNSGGCRWRILVDSHVIFQIWGSLSNCIQVEWWGYEHLCSKEKVKTLENLGGGREESSSCKGSPSCGGLNNFLSVC